MSHIVFASFPATRFILAILHTLIAHFCHFAEYSYFCIPFQTAAVKAASSNSNKIADEGIHTKIQTILLN